MSSKIKPFLFSLVLGLALGACSHTAKTPINDTEIITAVDKQKKSPKPEQNTQQNTDNNKSYFKLGRHYTYAIYNSDNKLISHPIEDWLKASADAQSHGEPYTDLYIISHGWNFTHQEAMAHFNRYLEVWDNKTYTRKFQPYIIFIVWNSTARPIGDTTRSILFYGMDDAISGVSDNTDKIIHVFTLWRQSLNAYRIALGRDSSKYYKNTNYFSEEPTGKKSLQGRNIPLSKVLYEIIKINSGDIPEVNPYNRLPFEEQRIHLVGHSYGAKLISLASLEALDRYYNGPETPYPLDMNRFEQEFQTINTIESLVLMNAAFSPNELNSFTEERIYLLWEQIPRKALVYTNTDYATGFLYDTSQIIFNSEFGQIVDQRIYLISKNQNYPFPLSILKDVFFFGVGGIQLVFNIGTSAALWIWRTAIYLPTDFYNHVVNNDTFNNTIIGGGVLAKIMNVPHFFMPLDKVLPFWSGENNFSDHQGFWRSTTTAIGRTGLHGLRRTNQTWLNYLGLQYAGGFEKFLANDSKQESSKISANEFTNIACSHKDLKSEPRYFNNGQLFYSFNGSKVYDTWKAMTGSHADLRKSKVADNCPNNIQKREATFNFITKFTLGERYPYSKK